MNEWSGMDKLYVVRECEFVYMCLCEGVNVRMRQYMNDLMKTYVGNKMVYVTGERTNKTYTFLMNEFIKAITFNFIFIRINLNMWVHLF